MQYVFISMELKSLKTKANKIRFHPFIEQTVLLWSPVELMPMSPWSSDGKVLNSVQPPILRAEDIKWRHTWSDTNLAGPKQFPDSSLTLATGAAVTLGCSVTTCSGINAASHVDVSQRIHVNGALAAPALCLELSSWVIFIKKGKMVQNIKSCKHTRTRPVCN